MTPEERARECYEGLNDASGPNVDRIAAYIRRAIEAERAACAALADTFVGVRNPKAPQYIADAIRARGKVEIPE